MDCFLKSDESYYTAEFNNWGRYSTYLTDNSEITYRKYGTTEWIDAIVEDDRVYHPHNKGVYPGEVYHVTLTNKGSINFGIMTNGTCSKNRPYEVKIENPE